MSTTILNFKKVEVVAASREEAVAQVENAYFHINGDATQAFKNWKQKQELYWNGKIYKRDSEEYQNLLNRAYNRLYENGGFYKALCSTNGATLEHSIGKSKCSETVLTKQEFCSRLTYLRDRGKLPEYNEKVSAKQLELGI